MSQQASRRRVWVNVHKLLLRLAAFVLTGALVCVLFVIAAFTIRSSPHSTTTERVWRYLDGESLAIQDVNDAARILAHGSSYRELEAVADKIVSEHPAATDLPEAEFDAGRKVPIEYLPRRFHHLGGSWRGSPQIILRVDESSKATQVRLHWGRGRHAVVVLVDALSEPPKGFHVRRVSERTYVLARDS